MTRILLVDDSEAFRYVLREMLEGAGHRVRLAENGKIAIELERQQPSELILMDLVMPEKEGIETILELLVQNANVRIIAISGGGSSNPDANLRMAKSLGAKLVLKKPFSRAEVLSAIEQVMAEPR